MTTNPIHTSDLEARAAAQREQILNSVDELKTTVRHKVDPRHQVVDHAVESVGLAALVGLIAGFWFGGVFKR
jgi:ElaB/YqjD/DUF883 family membrane-anchored ribosome-binding protein